jgi:hypothetical protein
MFVSNPGLEIGSFASFNVIYEERNGLELLFGV